MCVPACTQKIARDLMNRRNFLKTAAGVIEAIEMMLVERDVKGILVDTLSLDFGPSADFAVHYRWLPASKWGVEAVANLGELPASGAHVLVGGPRLPAPPAA